MTQTGSHSDRLAEEQAELAGSEGEAIAAEPLQLPTCVPGCAADTLGSAPVDHSQTQSKQEKSKVSISCYYFPQQPAICFPPRQSPQRL